MARTPPLLDDLHPWLRAKVVALSRLHQTAFPEKALALIWGHSSVSEQQAAYAAGRSRLDGRSRYSLHNFLPSLAADLWVYLDAEDVDSVLEEGRLPRGTYDRLCLLQKGDFKTHYVPLAKLSKKIGLEPGAFWRTLKDGPHHQVPKFQRLLLSQVCLKNRGFYHGALDGIFGAKSTKALLDACDVAQLDGLPTSRQRRLMPMTPPLWKWLHDERNFS